jgi:hypothetical protein
MDTKLLSKKFEQIGARVLLRPAVTNLYRRELAGIDIRADHKGEYFDIRLTSNDQVDYEVVDVRPDMRHLLLLARRQHEKQKFLCGHDERHWFVCAVPGDSVSNVVNAMEALQPREVKTVINRRVKRVKDRLRRRNKAFVRQGEWFFIRVEAMTVNPNLVLTNEPLSRGGGSKSHMCQYLYRRGGQMVWVCSKFPHGLTDEAYRATLHAFRKAKNWGWQRMLREPTVFVRGRVWHPDHMTIVLDDWHRVLMNTEREAPGARNVVFLD